MNMNSFSNSSSFLSSKEFNLEDFPKGKISRFYLDITSDALGSPLSLPIIIAKGPEEGHVFGLVSSIHGNELNGILVIQKLFRELDPNTIKGIIIGIPVVNIWGFFLNQREFIDGKDLNHVMPGKAKGNQSNVFAYRFIHRIISKLDYLVDLHTASFGRINSHYIRAFMENEESARMAGLQHADIILNSKPSKKTLRGYCIENGIPCITLEIGSPQKFQYEMINNALQGILNILIDLEFIPGYVELPKNKPIVCKKSYWLRTPLGGILTIEPEIRERIEKAQEIAVIHNIFGDIQKKFKSPESGVVIGKSTNPVALSGARIIHLGILEEKEIVRETFDWEEYEDWEIDLDD